MVTITMMVVLLQYSQCVLFSFIFQQLASVHVLSKMILIVKDRGRCRRQHTRYGKVKLSFSLLDQVRMNVNMSHVARGQ